MRSVRSIQHRNDSFLRCFQIEKITLSLTSHSFEVIKFWSLTIKEPSESGWAFMGGWREFFQLKSNQFRDLWRRWFSARSSRTMMIISQSNSIRKLLFFEFNHGLNSSSSKLPLKESKIIWNWQNEKKTGMTNCSSWSIFSLLLPSMATTLSWLSFLDSTICWREHFSPHFMINFSLSFIHRWFKPQLKHTQRNVQWRSALFSSSKF